MKGKVSIIIEGTVRDNGERITADAVGEYRFINGKHVIMYRETGGKDEKEAVNNIIKIKPGLVEMIKKGKISTQMVFDLSGYTDTVYNTPYGSFRFQIQTGRIDIEDKGKELIVNMDYTLSQNSNRLSDNHIYMVVKEM
jgi:Domain of unknown function (DUF1934).